jgi:hypothetical protein
MTGFDPSWSSLCRLGICSGTNLRLCRLVPNFYGNLRLAGAQTVWLLHFMLQMLYTTQQKKLYSKQQPSNKEQHHGGAGRRSSGTALMF